MAPTRIDAARIPAQRATRRAAAAGEASILTITPKRPLASGHGLAPTFTTSMVVTPVGLVNAIDIQIDLVGVRPRS